MKKRSIITNDMDHCIISFSPNVEMHHVLEGKNRKLSDEDGLMVPLSKELHNEGKKPDVGERCDAHHCKKMSTLLHIIGQQAWMMNYIIERYELPFEGIKAEAEEEFRRRYGKNYL